MLGIRLFLIGILASAVVGAGVYVMKLRSDNAILKANAIKMESAIADQKSLIENQKKDFQEILDANNKMNELVSVLKKALDFCKTNHPERLTHFCSACNRTSNEKLNKCIR